MLFYYSYHANHTILLYFMVIVYAFYFMQPPFPKNSNAYYTAFRESWLNVFIITAELFVFGAIIFVLLASGKEQGWATTDKNAKKQAKINEGSNHSVSGKKQILSSNIQMRAISRIFFG